MPRLLNVIISVIFLAISWQWLNSPMIVTVTGVGTVSVPATNATVSFTLSSSDANSQTAVSNVNAKALAIRTLLTSRGIAEGDIAEGQVVNVPAGLITTGASGYQATISMAAKTIHVADVSTLIADLYANGALVVSQPILSVEDQQNLEKNARDMAMKDAKKQASEIGNRNWKFIRKIIAVQESSSGATSTATTKADTLTQAAGTVASQNGVFKITKATSISYKMW